MKVRFTSGYIAITSAIIISVLVMTLVFATSLSGFSGRSNILDAYYKETSNALAEACVATALSKLAANGSYTGNENITVDGNQCAVLLIETAGGQKIIKTKAIFQKTVTNLKAVVAAADLSIVSWEELPVL